MKIKVSSKLRSRELMHGSIVLILLLFLMAPALLWSHEANADYDSPGVWYVDGDVIASGAGTTWATAFKTIQEAIDACPGWDQIWVKKGTYAISSTLLFDLWDDEAIYGGFTGGESLLDERDWKNNLTVIDGQHSVSLCVHIVDCAPTIDGFTIKGGGTGDAFGDLGGMLFNNLWSRFPTITNCSFRDNWASGWDRGGAITNFSSSPRVTNCTFYGNRSKYWGGAIFNWDASSPFFTNCTFSGNHADAGGGAMNNSSGGTYTPLPTLNNCILWGDTATSGAVEIHQDTNPTAHSNIDINQDGYEGTNGNIRQDPLFISNSGNLHIRPGSPCIDAGWNDAFFLPTTDMDGDPRIIDGDENTTDIVDIGADEFDPTQQFGVWYVNVAVPSSGDGTSWATAFKTIGEAVSAALTGDEIWVAQGTYNLGVQMNITTSVAIYGGFIGGETLWSQRDWVNNVTTVNGQNAVARCFNIESGTASPTIDGLTITGATEYGIYHSNEYLATIENCLITGNNHGIYAAYGDTVVNNCTFSSNSGPSGAGILQTTIPENPSLLTVTDCTFSGNSAVHASYGHGGAMYMYQSTAVINDCTFSGNSAVSSGGAIYNSSSTTNINNSTFSGNTGGYGGVISSAKDTYSPLPASLIINGGEFSGNESTYNAGAIRSWSPLTVNDCTFSENHGRSYSAIDCTSTTTLTNCLFQENRPVLYGNGAIGSNGDAPLVIDRCTFVGNGTGVTGGNGGAIYKAYNSITIFDSAFVGNTGYRDGGAIYNVLTTANITNSLFVGNSTTFYGAGALENSQTDSTITNCTFSGNTAGQYGYGGAIKDTMGTLVLTNSILWGDTDPEGDGPEIYNDQYSPSVLTVTYCDIDQDGYAGANGNIRQDPLFVDVTSPDPANWDLHLQADSPCIDMGTAAGAPNHDIEGTTRPVGIGYDMGAYEYEFTGQPDISVSPPSYDFGDVIVGESSAPLEIIIYNTGTAALNISDIMLSDTTNYSLDVNGGSNPAGSITPVVPAGDNCTVAIIFSPGSIGTFGSSVTIDSDDPDTPSMDVPLTGSGTAVPGDADEDGIIDSNDLMKVLSIILEADSPTDGADANQDGTIDSGDLVKVLRIILELE